MLLLGVTFKANIAYQRESPAVAIARDLRSHGVDLVFHDSHVADRVVLVRDHSAYDVGVLAEKSARSFHTKGATTHPDAIRL
ncbi:hypothetical protein IF650_09225 [Cellulosimicrobium terreum]|nr:hypothetical protein [Cellulosimicrobium terreum]